MNKIYNIIIRGVGGQGLITMLSVIDQAALIEGYDIKSSELHGLSQRGGSVETHVRFGRDVYSPLIQAGQADLVIGTEVLEGLRGFSQSGKNTKFLINNYSFPFLGYLKKEEIKEKLKIIPKNNLYLVPASEICKRELDNEVVSGIYLLGYAVANKLLPLKEESIQKAMEKIIPGKYLELNKKAFELAKK
jgi:indolepyruvate ferredoxin oxidoreductase, beta subunit